MIVAHGSPCHPVKLKMKMKTKDGIAEQIIAEHYKQGTFRGLSGFPTGTYLRDTKECVLSL